MEASGGGPGLGSQAADAAFVSNRARREEAVLSERFGQEWVEYKRRTKFLIPLIW